MLLWYGCDALCRPHPPPHTANHCSAAIRPATDRQQVIKYAKEAERWRSGRQSGSGGVSYKVLNNARET